MKSNKEAYNAFLAVSGYNPKKDDNHVINVFFERCYFGTFENETAFAEYIAPDLFDIPKKIAYYFDYEALARDLFVNDFSFWEGHVFINDF